VSADIGVVSADGAHAGRTIRLNFSVAVPSSVLSTEWIRLEAVDHEI